MFYVSLKALKKPNWIYLLIKNITPMGRRHSIAGKKAAGDAAKSQTYAKIGKLIEIAARNGGDDPTMNPALEMILQKARYNSLPKDVIDHAIKKWAGKLEWQELAQVMYEWYGPAGSAMYIKCITANTNRSAANIRSLLSKMGGNIAEPWAVSWQFSEKGVIIIDGKLLVGIKKWNEVKEVLPYDADKLSEELLELSIDDFQEQEWMCRVITTRENFIQVRKDIEKLWYNIADADIQYLPQNEITLSDEQYASFEKILEALQNDEDVDSIYHNVG